MRQFTDVRGLPLRAGHLIQCLFRHGPLLDVIHGIVVRVIDEEGCMPLVEFRVTAEMVDAVGECVYVPVDEDTSFRMLATTPLSNVMRIELPTE